MNHLKVVNISHSIDPDGLGSQAIIYRYFKELNITPTGLLADYYNFIDVLKEALSYEPNVLIISDIGINKRSFPEVLALLKQVKGKKIWIDHHQVTEEQKRILEEILDEFIHDTRVCAAELVHQRFMPNDEISKRIAEIGHNGDFDIKDKISEMLYTLIDFYRYEPEKLVEIRGFLERGEFTSSALRARYLEAYKKFEAEKDRIKKTYKKRTIGGKTIAIAESPILPRGKVTKFLHSISDADIILAVDPTKNRIGLRSDKYDVAKVAAFFGGGGHKHRSGFNHKDVLTEDNELSDKFKEKLEEILATIA
jgi:oligoribonuclease NrnB/cAMP/cGMP phosphodiesterase (DHH superfamily)